MIVSLKRDNDIDPKIPESLSYVGTPMMVPKFGGNPILPEVDRDRMRTGLDVGCQDVAWDVG